MDTHRITYDLRFPDESGISFPLEFTLPDFALVVEARHAWPPWTALEHNRCEHCPLTVEASPRCPLAVAIVGVVEATDQLVSHDTVDVEVTLPARTISASISAQDALRSLMGLIIPTSGCPHTAFFRPMARFHLPFSDRDETMYRVASMYVLSQWIRGEQSELADRGLNDLHDIYGNINLVNMYVMERLQVAAEKDSTRNALALLDVFAQLLPMQLDQVLDELRPYFDAYLK